MKPLLVVIIIYLTFMLSINLKLLEFFTRFNDKTKLQDYNLYLWFGIILVIGLAGLDTFYLAIPNQGLSITLVIGMVLVMVPFWFTSEYKPEKNLKGVLTFCIIFPIGEEILFRGIILSISTYLMGSNLVYVPVPLLKGVTLPVFISAIFFGINHFQYFGFKFNKSIIKKVLFAFIFGLFAGNLVEITGTVLYTIVFHIIANSGATLYYFRKQYKITES